MEGQYISSHADFAKKTVQGNSQIHPLIESRAPTHNSFIIRHSFIIVT